MCDDHLAAALCPLAPLRPPLAGASRALLRAAPRRGHPDKEQQIVEKVQHRGPGRKASLLSERASLIGSRDKQSIVASAMITL